jgi:phospholipid-binding lipoprotein MlaA
LLALLIPVGAACRSTSSALGYDAGVSSPPAGTREHEEAFDLPGIGDAPDVVPTTQPIAVQDPLEPVNRAFFQFNDKLYFWVLKPVSTGYVKVLPQPARRGVRNFFSNIATPVRLVNCALQGEFRGAWVELERFAINTTVGVAGFGDPARNRWNLESRHEDLGQTLGRYGLGPSIYICWPVIGPSSARDTVGTIGDLFLDPINYLVPRFEYNMGVRTYDTVNDTSLQQGEYEDFKDAAIDPYLALRDAYHQYRTHLVSNSAESIVKPAVPLRTESLPAD